MRLLKLQLSGLGWWPRLASHPPGSPAFRQLAQIHAPEAHAEGSLGFGWKFADFIEMRDKPSEREALLLCALYHTLKQFKSLFRENS
jgi:hypothetical protein